MRWADPYTDPDMGTLESSPVAGLANRISSTATAGQLLVLAYHGVDDAEMFGAQMRELVRHRRPVTLAAVEASLRGGAPIERGSVLVTFDDGHRSVLDAGMPILSDLAIPAALFVVTGLIGTDQPFWWNEVVDLVGKGGSVDGLGAHGQDPVGGPVDAADGPADAVALVRHLRRVPNAARLAAIDQLRRSANRPADRCPQLQPDDLVQFEAGGIAIGSHSVSHPCLDRCPEAEIREELVGSREHLESMLGHPVVSLAYPNGNVDERVRRCAADAGYELALRFDHRLQRTPIADPLLVSRVRVDSNTPMDRFRLLVSGAHSAIHHARGRS